MSIAAKHAYRFGFLKSEKWKDIRIQVLANKDACCDICGFRDLSNDVHHIWYDHPWDRTDLKYLVVLCRPCHEEVHEKMESPESKVSLFDVVRKGIRQSKGLPDDDKFGPRHIPAKELRAAYDNAKARISELEKELKPIEQKPKPVRVQSFNLKHLLCQSCKLNLWELRLDLGFEMSGSTISNKWCLNLCCACHFVLKQKFNSLKVKNNKIARLMTDEIKDRSPVKLLTI